MGSIRVPTAFRDNIKVVLTHLGWPEGDEWNNVYEYFDSAWIEYSAS